LRNIARLTTSVAASLTLTLGTAVAATAGSDTVKDKRQDVILSGKLSGDRTSAQKSFAYGVDVKSTKFSVGKKYVSVRWTFASLKPGTALQANAGFASRTVKVSGANSLDVSITSDSVKAWTNAPYIDDNFLCGDPDPAVVGPDPVVDPSAPKITPTVKFGRDGYIYAQFPRKCISLGSSNAPIRASFGVTSYQPSLNGTFEDVVSSQKIKTRELTSYVTF